MKELASRSCRPPSEGDRPLPEAIISAYLQSLPGWQVAESKSILRLEKSYQFSDFQQALDFANLVGGLAEEADHHPEILVSWGRTRVSWWTHAVRGLHENDFILAARTELVYQDRVNNRSKGAQ